MLSEQVKGQVSSNRRQSGNSSRRRRLARKPQKRMRTKPRGKVWSRNRRKKFFGGHRHQPLLALVGIVFPAESDLAVGKVHDPVIGDGDAMRVAGQIMEDMFGPAEGPLGVDHPILTEQRPQESMEGLLLRRALCRLPGNSSCPSRKARLRPATNLPRKTRLRTFTGRKKRIARVDPALVIGR